uniref:Uncharacterized protein n=1 Tax=Romanomermis culicivorax TaxID=13658 RepID=A0A915I475_ROMCU
MASFFGEKYDEKAAFCVRFQARMTFLRAAKNEQQKRLLLIITQCSKCGEKKNGTFPKNVPKSLYLDFAILRIGVVSSFVDVGLASAGPPSAIFNTNKSIFEYSRPPRIENPNPLLPRNNSAVKNSSVLPPFPAGDV